MNLIRKTFIYRTLLCKALWQLGFAHWQIHYTEFKKLSAQLGQPNIPISYQPTPEDLATIKKISIVVQKLGTLLGFKCFAQAIAAQRLLKKKNIPSQLYLGVHKKESELKAHAWLTCGELFITGKKGHEVFSSMIFYSSLCK